jgi:hypothetical protein
MSSTKMLNKLLIIPAVALGVLVLILVLTFKEGPKQLEIRERSQAVRIIPAPEVAILPRAVGYGIVQAGQSWEAVAEVGGKVIEIHPDLKKGALLQKGEVLLRIDPGEYGLAKLRAQADVENLLAQLTELDQKEKNTRHSLEVEKRALELSNKELERKRQLYANRHISKSELEQEEKRVLAQRNTVQSFQNTLNLIPSQKKALQARITSSKVQLKDTGLDIKKTNIRAPFHCRITDVNIELEQFAAVGKILAKADNISFVEILAQIPLYTFKNLVGKGELPLRLGKWDMDAIRKFLDFGVVVQFNFGGTMVAWQGRFARISETLDSQTRTLGVYVAVDDPYRKVVPGIRPPLIKNMYCEVEIRGKPRAKSVVIPRSTLHQGVVYVLDPKNRLEMRKVELDYTQGNLISIKEGLVPGEKVVVSDLIPAIQGMLLKPQIDEALLTSLIAEAKGEAPLK